MAITQPTPTFGPIGEPAPPPPVREIKPAVPIGVTLPVRPTPVLRPPPGPLTTRPPGFIGPIPGEAPRPSPTPTPTPTPTPAPMIVTPGVTPSFAERIRSGIVSFGRGEPQTVTPTRPESRKEALESYVGVRETVSKAPKGPGDIWERGQKLFGSGVSAAKGLIPTEEDPWIKVSPERAKQIQSGVRTTFQWLPGGGTGIAVGERIKAGTLLTPGAARDIGTNVALDALFFAPLAGPLAAQGLRTGIRTGARFAPGTNVGQILQMPIFSARQLGSIPGALWQGIRHPKQGISGFWQSDLLMPVRQPRETIKQLYNIGTGRTKISFTGGLGPSAATQTIPGPPPSGGPAPGAGITPPPSPGAGPRFGGGGGRPPSGGRGGPRPDFSRYGQPYRPTPPSGGNGGRAGRYTEAFGDPLSARIDTSQIMNVLGGRTPLSAAIGREAQVGTVSTLTRPTTGFGAVAETVAPPVAPPRTVPPWGPTRTTPGGPFQPGRTLPTRIRPSPRTPTVPEVEPGPRITPDLVPPSPGVRPGPLIRPQPSWPAPGPRIRTFPRTLPIGPFPGAEPAVRGIPIPEGDPALSPDLQRAPPQPGPLTGRIVTPREWEDPGLGTRGQEDIAPRPLEQSRPKGGPLIFDLTQPVPGPVRQPPPEEPTPGERGTGEGGPGDVIFPPFPWLPGAPLGLGAGGGGGRGFGRASDPFGYQLKGYQVVRTDPFTGERQTRRVGPRRIRAGRAAVGIQRRAVSPQAGRMRG